MVERIKSIINFYNLSPSAFADKIGVQRSALSHVLSGRNKPSLDFIVKIKKAFPDISMDWLTLGMGRMLQTDDNNNDTILKESDDLDGVEMIKNENKPNNLFESELPPEYNNESKVENSGDSGLQLNSSGIDSKQNMLTDMADKVDKIVWFYSNGTFSVFYPRQK